MDIGVDIVEIKRIENPEALAQRILTRKELDYFLNLKDQQKLSYLAGRWAAKEAIIKVNSDITSYQDIEILNLPSGKPHTNFENIKISISHEINYAVAVALYHD